RSMQASVDGDRVSATRDPWLGSGPDASVKGQDHARLPCRGWRSQRGMRGTRPARIARSADAAAAVKAPAFGGLDRPRTEASAGRAYLVCRAGFRRPRHAARAGHRAFHSRVRSRPEMYLGSASDAGPVDRLAEREPPVATVRLSTPGADRDEQPLELREPLVERRFGLDPDLELAVR